MINIINDEIILTARLLLATLFLIFGWRKLRDYSGTVSQMAQEEGLRMPILVTVVSIFMELPVAFAVAVGAFTRPSAVLLALYLIGTALIGHHYWTVKGADYVDSMEGFYKDLSIMGGFLLFVHHWCGKIFYRCIVRHRRAINCQLLRRRYNVTSRAFESDFNRFFEPAPSPREASLRAGPTRATDELLTFGLSLTVLDARLALPNFYNIAVGITDVTARLAIFVLWLRDKLGSSASP